MTSSFEIAIEHTHHQSFPEQIQIARWYRDLVEWADNLDPPLPGPGRYRLSVVPEALRGHPRPDTATLETWVRRTAADLATGRTEYRPTNVADGVPPDTPFAVHLALTRGSRGVEDGVLEIGAAIDMNSLEKLNIEQMRRTLDDKLPKLEEHRPHDGRTLLLLENNDIQLVNPDNVTEAVRRVAHSRPDLPDAIVMAHVFRTEAGLTWIKDGDQWHPNLGDRHYVRLE